MAARNGTKHSFYEEAMETFHRAADLIGMNPRVRMEPEEPDFEHIFYVTIETRDATHAAEILAALAADGYEPARLGQGAA